MSDVLSQLDQVIEQRIGNADPSSSYVAKLHYSGIDRILKKVGEESAETLIAAKNVAAGADGSELVAEVADLWFHLAVLLKHSGLGSEDVLAELARRFDMSGLEEKASRAPTDKL